VVGGGGAICNRKRYMVSYSDDVHLVFWSFRVSKFVIIIYVACHYFIVIMFVAWR
jgi:hypothetical protein